MVPYLSLIHILKDPDIFKKIPERQHYIEQFGAALTANGVITLAGSRIYTSMADNDDTIAETLSAFDEVFRNIEPVSYTHLLRIPDGPGALF